MFFILMALGVAVCVLELRQFRKALHKNSRTEQITSLGYALLSGATLVALGIKELGLDSFLATFSMVISIAIYLTQDKQTQEQHNQTQDFRKFEKDALENLRKGSQDAFDVLVAMRNDDLRRLSQDSERDSQYWKHKWVFESFEHVTLTTETGLDVSVKVLGTTLDFKKEKLIKTAENLHQTVYYICQVDEADQTKLFEQHPEFSRTGFKIALAWTNGELRAFSDVRFSNEGPNKDQPVSRRPLLDDQKTVLIEKFHPGKGNVSKPTLLAIDEIKEGTHYVNRIADYQIPQTQEKSE
jgi:hypothetical protein